MHEPDRDWHGADRPGTGALERLRDIANELARLCAGHDPRAAADTGILPPEQRPLLPALSPDALAERAGVERRLRAAVDAVVLPETGTVAVRGGSESAGAPVDPLDTSTRARVLRDHLRDRLDTSLNMLDSWEEAAYLGGLTSPLRRLRRELRPPSDQGAGPAPAGAGADAASGGAAQAWDMLARRLEALPAALADHAAALDAAAAHGVIAPRGRVLHDAAIARQLAESGAGAGGVGALLAAASQPGPDTPADGVCRRLERAAPAAADAARQLDEHLRNVLAPRAAAREGIGPQRHARWVARQLGTKLDAADAYAWASAELHEVIAAQDAIAVALLGAGAHSADLDAHLRADRSRGLSPGRFAPWAQEVADAAWEALVGPVLTVPAGLGRPAVALDAPGGGVHYEEPDPATGRSGTMLRSLAAGDDVLWPWAERTTVLHETVPGHHVHVGAQSVDLRLTDWQRHLARVPGCNEGWGLYAERLGVERGLIAEPADRYGWLAARRWRLARVLIDLGVHAHLPVPAEVAALPGASGARSWDRATATAVLRAHTVLGEGFVRFEVDRQLGWPAQGLAYVLGERVWLAGREAARRRAVTAGRDFDLRGFHDRAIALGSVGLDLLERELIR